MSVLLSAALYSYKDQTRSVGDMACPGTVGTRYACNSRSRLGLEADLECHVCNGEYFLVLGVWL